MSIRSEFFPSYTHAYVHPGLYMPACITRTNSGVHFTDQEAFIEVLRKENPDLIPGYTQLMNKEWQRFVSALQTKPFEEILKGKGLSTGAKAFLKKYVDGTSHPDRILGELESLFIKLQAMAKDGRDPVEIASLAHKGIIMTHPFKDGDGRVARDFMNLILKQAGLPPLFFPSKTAYDAAIQSGRIDEAPFTAFLRERMKAIQEEADPKVSEMVPLAENLRKIWSELSAEIQRDLLVTR